VWSATPRLRTCSGQTIKGHPIAGHELTVVILKVDAHGLDGLVGLVGKVVKIAPVKLVGGAEISEPALAPPALRQTLAVDDINWTGRGIGVARH
jgi:hypothetical protein